MKKHIEYNTKGTCSRKIHLEIENGVISACRFEGGCSGNTQGVSALVIGMTPEEAIKRLKGIRCGMRPTSCPDQLARALEGALIEPLA
ncbi:MAG: TIGR03905 family TSCPD domain-containing protein [Clostridia bacterium]|nr:TIGR03905 family TSCPD domain-containing protein [Clostridia bacterium]MBR3681087.1 TIGR03905 family TSCPD domain-containing protein [Clostridia bacterium]